MPLHNTHLLNSQGTAVQQLHRAEKARIRQAGTPVPPEHAVRLAQMRKAAHGIGDAAGFYLSVLFFDVVRGRLDMHAKLIVICAQKFLHIITPGAVHVVGAANLNAVQGDYRQRIHPFKFQFCTFAVQRLLRRVKHRAKAEVAVHQGQYFQFVIAHVRIGDESLLQQIAVYRAGYLRIQPAHRQAKALCLAHAQLPRFIQLLLFHCGMLLPQPLTAPSAKPL